MAEHLIIIVSYYLFIYLFINTLYVRIRIVVNDLFYGIGRCIIMDVALLDEMTYLTDLENKNESSVYEKYIVRYYKPIIEKVEKGLYKSPAFIQLVKSTFPKEQIVAVFSDDKMKKIKDGSLKIMQKKNGYLSGSLIDTETGHIVGDIDLRKMNFHPDVSKALVDYSMQRQISQLDDKIEKNYRLLVEIRAGQENDRIAHAIALEKDFVRIFNIDNTKKRKKELEFFVRRLEDVRQPLMKSQESNLKVILQQPDKIIKTLFSKSESDDEIKDRFIEIKRSYGYLNKVSLMGYMAYHDIQEYEQSKKFIEEHYNFIDKNYKEDVVNKLLKFDPDFGWDKLVVDSKKAFKYISTNESVMMLDNKDISNHLMKMDTDDINFNSELIITDRNKFLQRRKYARFIRNHGAKALFFLITFFK